MLTACPGTEIFTVTAAFDLGLVLSEIFGPIARPVLQALVDALATAQDVLTAANSAAMSASAELANAQRALAAAQSSANATLAGDQSSVNALLATMNAAENAYNGDAFVCGAGVCGIVCSPCPVCPSGSKFNHVLLRCQYPAICQRGFHDVAGLCTSVFSASCSQGGTVALGKCVTHASAVCNGPGTDVAGACTHVYKASCPGAPVSLLDWLQCEGEGEPSNQLDTDKTVPPRSAGFAFVAGICTQSTSATCPNGGTDALGTVRSEAGGGDEGARASARLSFDPPFRHPKKKKKTPTPLQPSPHDPPFTTVHKRLRGFVPRRALYPAAGDAD